MNILLASDIFPPESGGPATYVVGLANALQHEGQSVYVVTLNSNADTGVVSCPVFFVHAKNKLFRYIQYVSLLWKHSASVDVIYAMGPVNAGFPALIVSKIRRKKFFVKIVGDYAWEQGMQRFGVNDLIDVFQKKSYGLQVQCLRWVQSFVAQHAQGVIVPSDYLKGIVYGWGVNENRIHKIYNSIDFKVSDPLLKSPQEKWIVSVGRLVPWKGFSLLIDVIADLQKEFPNVRLKIIGHGPEQENLKLKIKHQELNGVVEMVGNIPHQKTLSYIQSADMFILNSGYEGLSHVMLEALSLGRPVVASRVGGNPELLEPFDMGALFEYNNAEEVKKIIRAYLKTGVWKYTDTSPDNRNKFFEQFSFSSMIEKTKKVLCS